MNVYTHHDPADPGIGLPGHIVARSADGIDGVEIRLRYDGRTGTAKALLALAKAAIEVCVAARAVKPTEPKRTFILAGSWAEGVEKAREVGVRPHARTTVILTTPNSTRGHVLRADDDTFLARPSAPLWEAWAVVMAHSSSREAEGSRWHG